MVAQQGVPIPIWGESAPGIEITVSFRDKTYHARADGGGKWRLLLDSQVPGGPYAMEISAPETEKITVQDIYVGEVWICSGQSNMELPMQRLKDDFPGEWKPPVNSLVRQFNVPQECEFSGPRQELSGGRWLAASAETLGEFSGTAWFFAQALFKKRQTPVGLINASWGGTPAEAWMSRDALAAFPEKIAQGEQYADPSLRDQITRTNEAEIKTWTDTLDASDAGLAGQWYRPETDVSQWEEISLPGDFAEAGLVNFCGVIWLRREFDASAVAGRDSCLWLGTVVDADTVYINGIEAGATTYRYPPRKYPLPAGMLHAGTNQIVIRVICNDGNGGVTKGKDFCLFFGDDCIELGGKWKYCEGAGAAPRPGEFFFHRQPMSLFNAMLSPLLGLPCKGILWYQGESNEGSPHEYAAFFTALINDWRGKQASLQNPLPFLFVQLPIFGEPEDNDESNSWAVLREAQQAALSLPATGMAAALELGEWNDIHPVNKKGVGYRLALAAEKTAYNNPNTSPGPLFRSIERQGDRLLITFNNCGKGLAPDAQPYITVVAEGGLFRLPLNIEGPDCVSADISTVKNPEKVLYAWAANPRDRQLFNADGLPAIPFRVKIKGGTL